MTPWTAEDDLASLAQQLHDERCISWGCPGTPHTVDWLMARRMLRGEGGG
jgi:hypothetical protein